MKEDQGAKYLPHVLYEIMGYAMISLQQPISENGFDQKLLDNILIESKGIHARNLIETFTNKKTISKIKCNEFYNFKALEYGELSPNRDLKTFKDVYDQLCIKLAHLSIERYNCSDWTDCFKFLDEKLLPTLLEFLRFLREKEQYKLYERTIKFCEDSIEGSRRPRFQTCETLLYNLPHDITDTSSPCEVSLLDPICGK
ncbi:MAG: hypothetical protein ACYCX2_05290 [Christensenellales bacterium]